TVQADDAWQDDSGDVAPADPTLAVDVDPFDWQHPNGESRRQATIRVDGGGIPGIVVEVIARDSEFYIEGTPLIKANLYANGYQSPATKVGVLAQAIDPNASPEQGQRLLCIERNGKTYFETGAAANASIPAKVTELVSPGVWKGDLYTKGHDADPTTTGVKIITSDLYDFLNVDQWVDVFPSSDKSTYLVPSLNQQTFLAKITSQVTPTTWQGDLYGNGRDADPTDVGLTFNVVGLQDFAFVAGDWVNVFTMSGVYYISTARPFQNNPVAIQILMKIISNDGGGAYTMRPISDIGGSFTGAAVTVNDCNGSVLQKAGDYRLVHFNGTKYFVDLPLKAC